ncbi:MAG: ATP-binding protein [Rhodocyclaceae bacterium]|jgi:protein-histidine pros-kinase|nr:ATP-binding protein [Rhodocyclaceae bacterium]
MKRHPAWPATTLFSRLMLIWLIGISLVLATSLAFFMGARERHDRDLLFEGIAREVAATLDLLEQMSADERHQHIDSFSRRRLRFSLRPPPGDAQRLPERIELTQIFQRALGERPLRLYILHPTPEHPGPPGQQSRLLLATALSDGTPLSIRLPVPPPAHALQFRPGGLAAALLALIAGISLIAWLAVRLATRPLSRLAQAAHALGEDPNRPPLPESGPVEVIQAARAFNQMQERIREHVGERTRILAAISHDLQTPITRLRLRAEQVDDAHLRSRIQSDLDAMQSLVREGLDYARSLEPSSNMQPTDLNGLLAALVEDGQDMGWSIRLQGLATHTALCHPVALRRALWNLIENGVKFGQQVDILIEEDMSTFRILIHDHGPGLPEAELEKVFEPFYRTEQSRNRDTGGTGLGLAIARNLIRAQGGDIRLSNAPEGGLRAEVRLHKREQA